MIHEHRGCFLQLSYVLDTVCCVGTVDSRVIVESDPQSFGQRSHTRVNPFSPMTCSRVFSQWLDMVSPRNLSSSCYMGGRTPQDATLLIPSVPSSYQIQNMDRTQIKSAATERAGRSCQGAGEICLVGSALCVKPTSYGQSPARQKAVWTPCDGKHSRMQEPSG
jgi:hypothetical protein